MLPPILGIFSVLLISYILVLVSVQYRRRLRAPGELQWIEDYLYQGNRPSLAISSGIGSMFSYSLAGTALLSIGYVFGWQVCGSILAGACTGLATYLALLRNPRLMEATRKLAADGFTEGASYSRALAESSGRPLHYTLTSYLLLVYSAILLLELAVIRVTIGQLLGLPTFELDVLIAALVIICYAYVFAGGYRAVLLTDHFQLAVILLLVVSTIPDIDINHLISTIPLPTSSRLAMNKSDLVLLHIASFISASALALGNVDHWYRTVGTLKPKEAKKVLIIVATITTLSGMLIIILGSTGLVSDTIPPGTTMGASLDLIGHYYKTLNPTSQLLFGMLLTCVGLTTIDTYIITIAQLHYELTIHLHTKSHHLIIIEKLTKLTSVRAVAGIIAIGGLGISFLVPDQGIYALGVVALGGIIPVIPILLVRALNLKLTYDSSVQVGGLLLSVLLIAPAILSTRLTGADLTLNLYLIVLAIAAASAVGYSTAFAFKALIEAARR